MISAGIFMINSAQLWTRGPQIALEQRLAARSPARRGMTWSTVTTCSTSTTSTE